MCTNHFYEILLHEEYNKLLVNINLCLLSSNLFLCNFSSLLMEVGLCDLYVHWALLLWLRTSQSWSGAGCLRHCWFARAQCAAEVSSGHPNPTWAAHQHHLSQGALLCSNLWRVLHLTDQAGGRCSNRTLFLLNLLICWNGSILEMFPHLSDSDASWARLHSTVPNGLAVYLGLCGFLGA